MPGWFEWLGAWTVALSDGWIARPPSGRERGALLRDASGGEQAECGRQGSNSQETLFARSVDPPARQTLGERQSEGSGAGAATAGSSEGLHRFLRGSHRSPCRTCVTRMVRARRARSQSKAQAELVTVAAPAPNLLSASARPASASLSAVLCTVLQWSARPSILWLHDATG